MQHKDRMHLSGKEEPVYNIYWKQTMATQYLQNNVINVTNGDKVSKKYFTSLCVFVCLFVALSMRSVLLPSYRVFR